MENKLEHYEEVKRILWPRYIKDEVFAGEITKDICQLFMVSKTEPFPKPKLISEKELVEKIAKRIRDYANQQIEIVVNAKVPREPLTSEGIADSILSDPAIRLALEQSQKYEELKEKKDAKRNRA